MSNGLRDLLNLPETTPAADDGSDAADGFREAFSGLIQQANESLQSMAANAPADVREQAAAQRDNLYNAYQTVAKKLAGGTAEGATKEVDRVVAAAKSFGKTASSLAADSQNMRDEWAGREEDFDNLQDKVSQLEAARHPRAAALSRLIEIIQEKESERDFAAATDALDRGSATIDELYETANAERAAGKRTVWGGGGYVYEQHADGRIFILQSPRSKGDVRIELKRGGKGYNAVLEEIGPFPADDDVPLPINEATGDGDASPILDALIAAGREVAEKASDLADDASEFIAEKVSEIAQLFGFDDEGPAPDEETTPDQEQTEEEAAPEFDLLGGAETDVEKQLAEFTQAMKNIEVEVDGQTVNVRPPYHWNKENKVWEMEVDPETGKKSKKMVADPKTGKMKPVPVIDPKTKKQKTVPHKIKREALEARNDNPKVKKLINAIFGGDNRAYGKGAKTGKATPEQMKDFLEESLNADLIEDKTAQGMKDYLDKFGISTDCSGLVSQGLNFLNDGDMTRGANELVNASETGTGTMTNERKEFAKVKRPTDLAAGDIMAKSGHVRLVTDVDIVGDAVEFTTLESTTAKITDMGDAKVGSGVGEVRWRFPDKNKFAKIHHKKTGKWKRSSANDVYIYTRLKALQVD